MTWQNLGPRADDTSGRAWLAIPVRPADGSRWLYSGTTNGEGDLMRWDSPAERWRMVLKGPMPWPRPAFPAAGATHPAPTDNGFAVWAHEELYVNAVNPSGYDSAVYDPLPNKWYPVVAAGYPEAEMRQLFNAASASNADVAVLYGGSLVGTACAHLWAYDGAWAKHANHGLGAGKPGAMKNMQNQMRWAPTLGRFLLYHSGNVWTLHPDTLVWEQWVTTGTAPTAKHPVASDGTLVQGLGLEILGDYAIVCGGNPHIYGLHLPTRAWRRLGNEGAAPNRFNGAVWSANGHLYQCWGTNQSAPADVWRFPDVLAALGTEPVVRQTIAAIERVAA